MADPRIIVFNIPVEAATTHFQIQFSRDRLSQDTETWTTLMLATVTDLPISLLANRQYTLDGINAVDSATNNPAACSTPPMQYRIRLKATSVYGDWSDPFVVPSEEDFILGMRVQLKDPSVDGIAPPLLALADYRRHLANAVAAFEKTHPASAVQNFTLATDVQSYALPDRWSTRFSRILRVEYPSGQSPKLFVPSDYVVADEEQAVWTFQRVFPSTSEYARLYYTTRHGRSGKTVPVAFFDSVLMWACGDAAQQLRAKHNQMGNPYISAEIVDIDPRVREWGKIAESWKAQAEKIWGTLGSGVRTHLEFADAHGRVPDGALAGFGR